MRVFVTGATGWVGSAVVRELIGAGHQVLGLARSDQGAAALAAAGAQVRLGAMEDLDGLKQGAAQADGVIHTAFNHDFSRFADNCAQDRRAILALGEALAGTGRPLIVTSGMAFLASGRPADEDDRPPVPSAVFPRASEDAATVLAERGVRAAAMRLPPSVHGAGDHGFIPILIRLAREKGVSAYVGDGLNRWPAVHRNDAARAYVLALAHLAGGGEDLRYHAAAEDGVPFRDIAEVIGRRLGLPVVGLPPEDAAGHFGWFAGFAGMDAAVSSTRTRGLLGWRPKEQGLLEDMEQAGYFQA